MQFGLYKKQCKSLFVRHCLVCYSLFPFLFPLQVLNRVLDYMPVDPRKGKTSTPSLLNSNILHNGAIGSEMVVVQGEQFISHYCITQQAS